MLQKSSFRAVFPKKPVHTPYPGAVFCLALIFMLCLTACRRSSVWQVLPPDTGTKEAAEITAPSPDTDPPQTGSMSEESGSGTETEQPPATDDGAHSASSAANSTAPESVTQRETEPQTDRAAASETRTAADETISPPVTKQPETVSSDTKAPETEAPAEQPYVPSEEDLSASVPRYAYEALSDSDRKQYTLILESLLNRRDTCTFPERYSKNKITKLISAVLADYPEIFWTTGAGILYTFPDGTKAFSFQYIMTEEEISAHQTALSSVKAAFLKSLPADASEYEKAIAVYEYLIRQTRYDTETYQKCLRQEEIPPVSQTLCNALLDRYAVCTGYAKAAQYLLHASGMEATLVTGTASGSNHAWIVFRMNGIYYHMDACWGDPTNENGEDTGKISYLYFAMSDEEIFLTHSPDVSYPLPACPGGSDTYFRRNGLWFDSYDRSAVGSLLFAALSEHRSMLSFRFSSDSPYREAVCDLITDKALSKLLLEAAEELRIPAPQLAYSKKDDYALITLYFTYSEA